MTPTAFPSYLTSQPQTGQLQSLYRQAPAAFDTSGYENSVRNMAAMNLAQGRSMASNDVRAAENRAFRGGGKVAASFAGAQSMLPYLQENEQQMASLADYKLRAAQSRLQAQAGLADSIAGYGLRGAGMLADYDQASQNRLQQGGQFDKNLAQQAAQFNAQQALRLRQQDFSERQYSDMLGLRTSQRYGGGYGGGGSSLPSWANVAAIMGAQNAALGQGRAANFWQQTGAAARGGGFENTPVFGTGSTGGYSNTITGAY